MMGGRRGSILTLSSASFQHAQWRPASLRVQGISTSTSRWSSSSSSSGSFNRSDFGNQPFTGIYEPGQPTPGPLGGASMVGAPRVTPKMLKQHLDQFVVGQERAKKVLSTAVYNHYQRIQELQRQEDEYEELMAKNARREMANRHPIEDEYPGQQATIHPQPPSTTAATSGPSTPTSHHYYHHHHHHLLHPHDHPPPAPSPLPPAPAVGAAAAAAAAVATATATAAATEVIAPEESLTLEKSNILLLGPSGVGKTLMAKTLARILDVPFSMSDCTPLTQAGYIGEDAEVVVQRLLAAANYDVSRAETGIICLDEIDKIASAKVSHGKDVGGEGVQQALLKIVEGTGVSVQAKTERTSATTGRERQGHIPSSGFSAHGPAGAGGASGGMPPPGAGKNEVYTVRTDNILFICTGAFIGLHKLVLERIAKGSMGFNAPVRASNSDSSAGMHDTIIKIDSSNAEIFREHLPFWNVPHPSSSSPYTHSTNAPLPQRQQQQQQQQQRQQRQQQSSVEKTFVNYSQSTSLNTLDLITPTDLQKYGLIPELVGRIPITCALSPLDEDDLVRVLTEPRNALLRQFETLFALSGIEMRFTSGAIREVAKRSVNLGTGARGLRGVLEGVLGESMFEGPGSSTKYVLITADVIKRKAAPIHLARGQGQLFQSLLAQEEDSHKWPEEEEEAMKNTHDDIDGFEEYRKKSSAAGV